MKKYCLLFEEYTSSGQDDKFQELYDDAPDTLKRIIDNTKGLSQNPKHHKEDVYDHIRMVTNGAWNSTHDIDMALVGFFHDLGKIATAKPAVSKDGSRTNYNTFYDHEKESAKLVDEYIEFIEKWGGNIEKIYDMVKYHMAMLSYDQMTDKTRSKYDALPYFQQVKKFKEFDIKGRESDTPIANIPPEPI